MSMRETTDFLVIGGGVVGSAIAREVANRWPHTRVLVIDKESEPTHHASGRNSGVLHAGFYYSPDSLKARLTRDGNRLLKEFCAENDLPVRECGKVVVTTSAEQLPALETLYQRGLANGVVLEKIDESQLRELEPLAITHETALWSPSTAVADPRAVTLALGQSAERLGVRFGWNEEFRSRTNGVVVTSKREISAGHVINCSGLHADRVATEYGMQGSYVMLPFIGLYSYAPRLKGTLTRHVYPVPDPRNPFLGVHATVTVDGSVKIGPTAIPAFSREAYRAIRGINLRDFAEIVRTYPRFLLSPHHKVARLIATEVPKYSRSWLVHEARKLVPSLRRRDFIVKGKPGIRAQLFNKTERRLEMDFVIHGDEHSTHVLNAVSPAWTSSLSFAGHVVDDISRRHRR
jgi:L-2-hydroxyglutarate oxidase LhgO